MCFEYVLHPLASFRLEARYAYSMDKVYRVRKTANASHDDTFVMAQFLFDLKHIIQLKREIHE